MMDISTLFLDEYTYMLRGLMRLGVLERDVRDVMQEVFLEVWRELPAYDSARPLRPWLYAFMVRFAANYRRLARHREITLATLPDASQHSDANANARDLVLRALESLGEEQRACVVMHDFEGFTAQEIADATATPIGTVYSRIRLGREAFRCSALLLEGSA
jgi:RNA polymerase sigma-70 factor, ECF subfamily